MKRPDDSDAIRQLVTMALSDEDLVELCFDSFRPVHDEFTSGMSRSQKIQRLIEFCEKTGRIGELLARIEQLNQWRFKEFVRDQEFLRGSYILQLLMELDSEPLLEDVKNSWEKAYEQQLSSPATAIELSKKALHSLNREAPVGHGNPHGLRYARGKLSILIASIYLDRQQNADLQFAEKYYENSQVEFHRGQWKHLESLAYLGLAIALRKSKKFDEAMDACKKAQECVEYDSITVNIENLTEAIKDERDIILPELSLEMPSDSWIYAGIQPIKKLQLFDITIANEIIAKEGTIDLDILSQNDYVEYERSNLISSRFESFDLTRFSGGKVKSIHNASYILEVPTGIKTDDGLQGGDKVIIQEQVDHNDLHGKRVVVLVVDQTEQGVKLRATLKTFFKAARHHYFLKASNPRTASIIVFHYKSKQYDARRFYKDYEKSAPVESKPVYGVRITGEVKGIIRRKSLAPITTPPGDTRETSRDPSRPIPFSSELIWELPIVGNIAAGLSSIKPKDVVEYRYLNELECKSADFGVRVVGNSMKGHNILDGDIALIQRQEMVQNKDIAAVIILTDEGPLEVIKQFHFHDKQSDRTHWFLKSSNSSSDDLLVMPPGVDILAIQRLYRNFPQLTIYANAELTIAGKYVGSLKSDC